MGRILGAHGVSGWIRVKPYGDIRTSILLDSKRWWLLAAAEERGALGVVPIVDRGSARTIENARAHGGSIVAKLLDCNDRDAAQALCGFELGVPRGDFPEPDEGEYYWADLIGCVVVTRTGDELGVVESLADYGADPVLCVRDARQEHLIPFVAAHVVEVSLSCRSIVVDWEKDF